MTIPFLTGLDESYGPTGGDASSAPFAYNIRTDYGQFAPARGYQKYIEKALPADATRAYLFADRNQGQEMQFILIGTPSSILVWRDDEWQALYSNAQGGDWGFVTYQNGEEVLLLAGNGVDPLLYWDGVSATAQEVEGAPCTGNQFCVHFERVFCAGDPSYPDRVFYSRAFAPFDWSGDTDHPENGGGFVDIPTWDGGKITSILSDGQDVLVGKTTSVFRLYGTTPADFTIMPVSGSMGITAPLSHALSGVTHYYVSEFGVATYYGGNFSLMDDRKLPRIFDEQYVTPEEDIHLWSGFGGCCAAVADSQQRVLFALPLGPDATENNAVLEYDVARQLFLLRRGFNVVSWMKAGNARTQILFLGRRGQESFVYAYEKGNDLDGEPQPYHWETPWMDLTAKYARKRVSSVRLFGSMPDGGAVRLTIETDKCRRERILSAQRLRSGSLRFATNAPGERFRFLLDSVDGAAFSFSAGLELEVELDE